MLFGYTKDYIGQLSRSGKIGSAMVGRDRFVDYSSLSKYTADVEGKRVPTAPKPSDQISVNKQVRAKPVFAYFALAVLLLVPLYLLGRPALPSAGEYFTINLPDSQEVGLMVQDVDQTANVIASSISLGRKVDALYLGFLNSVEDKIATLASAIRDKTLAFLSPIIGEKEREERVVVESRNSTSTSTTIVSSGEGLSESDVRTITENIIDERLSELIDYTSTEGSNNFGIVVRPSSGDAVSDESIKQSVRDAFSDEVDVTLDNSRSAGLIRPVFRSPTDDSFVFVIVPVDQR